jgi:hypothetical protein
MTHTKEVLDSIRVRLICDIDHAEEDGLAAITLSDLRSSLEVIEELWQQPETFTGDPITDISHHLFFAGIDSYPRDMLLQWVEELA